MSFGPLNTDGESDLWLCFKTGNKTAFAEIYERYVGVLYNYGFHISGRSEIVEDAIQDLFLNLWQSRERLSDTTSIKYYLFRSLRRQIVKASEKNRRDERHLSVQILEEHAVEPSVEIRLIAGELEKEQWQELRMALRKLTSRQLEAIRLYYYEGFDLPGIASIMEMNEQSVRNILQRALIKLRHVMQLFPFILSAFQNV